MSQYQRLLLIADHTLYHSPALLRAVALAKACDAALGIRSFIEPTPMVHLWETRKDLIGSLAVIRSGPCIPCPTVCWRSDNRNKKPRYFMNLFAMQ